MKDRNRSSRWVARSRKVLALVAGLALVALVACGEAGEVIQPAPATPAATPPAAEETPPAAAEVIQIRLGEMFFQPDVIRVKAGQPVAIELTNEGVVLHEFMVGREVEMHEGIAEGFEHDFFEGVEVEYTGEGAELEREEEHGTSMMLEAGGKGVLNFTVPVGTKGEWEIGCFVPGHYEAGMKGKLSVE